MRFIHVGSIALGLLTITGPAFAQFATDPITGTVTTTQTLSSGTGTVASTGQIRIASGSSNAVNMTGTVTLINGGTIQTLGSGRAIDTTSGAVSFTVTNNGIISSVSSDAFRVNANASVSLFNTGIIRVTAGGQAIDWANITSASNVLTNSATGTITAVGEDAVRPGVNGQVFNSGVIMATPTISGGAASGSDGIDLRTLSGIHVNNSGEISGRHGIATDGSNAGPSTFFLTNSGVITGRNGSGLNIDGVSATVRATVVNDGAISGGIMAGVTDGDGDGIDVDGVLDLTNSGNVTGRGARGGTNNAEGVAAGGGSIVNLASGRIVGFSNLIDAPNGDATRAGNGILIDDSNGSNAVAATTVDNSGVIQGTSGFAIKMVGNFADRITNNSGGAIQGAGTSAAIQMGDGNDVLVNRGQIVSDIGNAIDLQGGNDTLSVEGNAAYIVGDVSGGAGTNTAVFNLGDGGVTQYAGVLSNFSQIEIQSGVTELSGANQYDGRTIIGHGTLVLNGTNRLAAASSLELGDGSTLELANALGANAQTLSSLTLNGHATIDLGLSSLTFNALDVVAAGSTLTVIDWSGTASPDYAFRFLGDLSGSNAFLALVSGTTINGSLAGFIFDGTYTNVSAVPLPGGLLLLASGLGLLRMRRRPGKVYTHA